ncbi:MAG: tRNA (cytidine(34)-2'-O)-methyltransferase [Gammaproteobacteria bacterium]|nr:tRNA (cytidine(34)-2'-O)-methyltransferase [Gammaproteobacteria bacterium]
MFHIALYEPKIAPNTGNIIRLAANNGCKLHIVEPMGFDFEEKKLRRAGLDYHDLANVTLYPDYQSLLTALPDSRVIACTTKGQQAHDKLAYQAGDLLLFGSETHGLPVQVMDSIAVENRVRIPMQEQNRSLNLSNAVAIISYEAWRQHDFRGGS